MRGRAFAATACLVALSSPFLGAQRPPPIPSVKVLVERASDYVAAYQRDFSQLLADETYEQRVTNAAGREIERRTTHGELFLAYLQAERHWVAVRDVADVNGMAVYPRDDLQTVLRQGSVASIALRLFERNARFNIGGAIRTFNEPTMPLLVLGRDRAPNFKFSRGPISVDAEGVVTATIHFEERDTPTLIQTSSRRAIYSTGEIVVEVNTGRVRRTTLAIDTKQVTGEMTTTYGLEPRLGLWAPLVFTEHYLVGDKNNREVTTCTALYTDYRKFETSGRIVAP